MNNKDRHARCCDDNFLLAEAEVVMTTLTYSQLKITIVSSLNKKFSILEKSWYFIGIYIINDKERNLNGNLDNNLENETDSCQII